MDKKNPRKIRIAGKECREEKKTLHKRKYLNKTAGHGNLFAALPRTGSFSGFCLSLGYGLPCGLFTPGSFYPVVVCKWPSFKEFSQMARFPLFTDFFSNCDISRILYLQ
jgi:hypothetical protein